MRRKRDDMAGGKMEQQRYDLHHKKVSDLIPYVNNSRTHSDEQVLQVASSIKEFGFTNPVLIDEAGMIIAGHGRVMAAKKLNLDEVPCLVLEGLTEAQKKAYVIADNKLALNSGWDEELLRVEIEGLDELGFDLDLLGFSADELGDLLKPDEVEGLTDEDAVPEAPENPVSVLGDIWQLGNHRIMCGDSTDITSFEKLMNGEKADITFTSPPYNVGTTPNGNDQKYINNSDDLTTVEYVDFLNSFTTICLSFSDYVFSNIQSLSGNKVALIEHMFFMKEKFADTIIWDKETAEPAMARRVLNSRFEYIHIFSNEAKRTIGKRDFRGDIPNLFRLNSRKGKEYAKIHKATFRVELPEMFLENFTESSCIEPFCGTGTTLIACEKNNRKCFAMEFEPQYCDVTIKRWEQFTGKQAVHIESGKTYEELKDGGA